MKSVFVCVPIHRSWSHESQDYFFQCLEKKKNWSCKTVWKIYEQSLIITARNEALDQFIKSGADYLFFLDDDIVLIRPDSIDLLVATGFDIIGGAYIMKKPPHVPTFHPFEREYPDLRGKTEPFRVLYAGTGCLLISRKCAINVRDKFPYPFQMCETILRERNVLLSEDWSFCHRAGALGFKIFIHPALELGHLGTYAYSMSDYYAFREGVK